MEVDGFQSSNRSCTYRQMGKINLDLLDLRTISLGRRSTVLVGEGMGIDANRIFRSAFDAPLERIDVANAAAFYSTSKVEMRFH